MLLLFGTLAHLLSPEEGSCYILPTRNNCFESLVPYGVIFQGDFQRYFKTPVCGAAFSYSYFVFTSKNTSTIFTIYRYHITQSWFTRSFTKISFLAFEFISGLRYSCLMYTLSILYFCAYIAYCFRLKQTAQLTIT